MTSGAPPTAGASAPPRTKKSSQNGAKSTVSPPAVPGSRGPTVHATSVAAKRSRQSAVSAPVPPPASTCSRIRPSTPRTASGRRLATAANRTTLRAAGAASGMTNPAGRSAPAADAAETAAISGSTAKRVFSAAAPVPSAFRTKRRDGATQTSAPAATARSSWNRTSASGVQVITRSFRRRCSSNGSSTTTNRVRWKRTPRSRARIAK